MHGLRGRHSLCLVAEQSLTPAVLRVSLLRHTPQAFHAYF
ncbi:hypothetical protein HMPREF9997_01281 [Corynebacterium durum F0235]|uniref:Uncharacterized protein n=1 Tax=Corynebacterium durum F0235 TaxID=1035195 RepID=L1MFN9_9CORY|nr:hypothetical protein HMPREF9997_01281 [Corynebacterium durum F0235]